MNEKSPIDSGEETVYGVANRDELFIPTSQPEQTTEHADPTPPPFKPLEKLPTETAAENPLDNNQNREQAGRYQAYKPRKSGDVMKFSPEEIAEVRAAAKAGAAKREAAKKSTPREDQLPSPNILDTLPPPPKPPAKKPWYKFW